MQDFLLSPPGWKKGLLIFLLFPAASSLGMHIQAVLPDLCCGPFPHEFVWGCSETPLPTAALRTQDGCPQPFCKGLLAGGVCVIQLLSSAERTTDHLPSLSHLCSSTTVPPCPATSVSGHPHPRLGARSLC